MIKKTVTSLKSYIVTASGRFSPLQRFIASTLLAFALIFFWLLPTHAVTPVSGSSGPATMDANGAVNLTAGGSDQAVNLTSTGTGNIVLNGSDVYAKVQTNRYFIVQGPGSLLASITANGGHYTTVSTALIKWNSSATNVFAGTDDTGFGRNAAGVAEIDNGTAGTYRDLLARGLRSNAVTFANAIASPVEGTMQSFTDSTTNTWGATITGGGSNHVLGYFNGTNWTVFGK